MNEEDLRQYVKKKKIRLILKNNNIFTGHIKNLTNTSVTVIDKFENEVTIDLDDISYIAEVKENG